MDISLPIYKFQLAHKLIVIDTFAAVFRHYKKLIDFLDKESVKARY